MKYGYFIWRYQLSTVYRHALTDGTTIGQMSIFHERPESAEEILRPGKQPERVRARSLACYWAVKELGMNGSAVSKLLGIIQSPVSRAVQRGEKLALENHYSLEDERKA